MASVTLRNLRKFYGDTEVLHGVDCEVADGELLVVVGPSGCGKSTLLRMIAGLEKISDGEIAIDGRVVNTLEPAARDIAMVFQNYALYPHMTVFDNMAYGLKIRKLPKAEIAAQVRKAAAILELPEEMLRRKPRQLSGGQRQRVAMGRAIVREPAVFLFDEPLSNLDAKLRVQMRIEIKKLQETLGITSIYVTHDQVEAMTLGHRLMVLKDGHVEQIGAPMALYDRPETIFVAGFIGSPAMNFVPAQSGEGGATVMLSGGDTLAVQPSAELEPGRAVTVGIRPEHFEVASESEGVAHLRISLVERLGADIIAHGHFGDDSADLTIRLPGAADIEANATLPLAIAPQHLHLFDPETGKRL